MFEPFSSIRFSVAAAWPLVDGAISQLFDEMRVQAREPWDMIGNEMCIRIGRSRITAQKYPFHAPIDRLVQIAYGTVCMDREGLTLERVTTEAKAVSDLFQGAPLNFRLHGIHLTAVAGRTPEDMMNWYAQEVRHRLYRKDGALDLGYYRQLRKFAT